jgi:hypothetical protein
LSKTIDRPRRFAAAANRDGSRSGASAQIHGAR